MGLRDWLHRHRRRQDEDLDAEIASHLALAVQDRVAAGEDPEAARLAAHREFGNVTLTREATRLTWGVIWLDRLMDVCRDARHALRQLARAPAYSLVIVTVLGLGIGANLIVFGLFKAIVVTPLGGVAGAGGLHAIGARSSGGEILVLSYPDFQDVRARDRAHSGLAASSIQPLGFGVGDRRERVWTELVSGEYFQVLGVAPQLGRALEPADEFDLGGTPVAVLSDALWRRAFGASPDVIGSVIHLNSYPVTVVGVAPPGFHGSIVGLATELFVPITMVPPLAACCDLADRQNRWVQVLGRLPPGGGLATARAEAERLSRQLSEEHPIDTVDARATIVPLWRWPYGAQTFLLPGVALMGAMAALLLVVVCANVAGLALVRSLSRRSEVAVRLVLGASHARVLRLLACESLALAVPGALLGLALPWLVAPFLEQAGSSVPLPMHFNFQLDGVLIAGALALAGVCAVLYGVVPARTALRVDLAAAARDEIWPSAAASSRLRAVLVVSQVAMALMLLVGTGLVVRSVDQARRADPGFDPANVATAVLDLRLNAYDPRTGPILYDRLLESLRADPAVEAASLAAYLPLTLVVWEDWSIEPEGYVPRPGEALSSMVNVVSPDHFRTLRLDLAAGRDFEATDDEAAPRVAIVNETFARRFWGTPDDAIGRRLQAAETWWTIVGVARDAKYARIDEDPRPYLYMPLAQQYRPTMTVQVRAVSATPMEIVRQHVRAIDPDLPLVEERMLEDQMRFAASIYEYVARTLALVGLIAILLAALGIYGLVSYTSKQRAHEIGIRMAMGAPARTILRRFLGQGLRLGSIGVAIGLLLALGAARLMGSQLYGIAPIDPVTFAGASAIVVAMALAASLVPAWRASRSDPLSALRRH